MSQDLSNFELFYKSNTLYEITINPDDLYQHFEKKQGRFYNFYSDIKDKLLSDLAPHADYKLYIELSEPFLNINYRASVPRFHLHGTILLHSAYSFLEYGLYELSRYCNVTINPYRPEYWYKYCTKQQEVIASCHPVRSKICHQRDDPPEEVDIKVKSPLRRKKMKE